MAVKFFNLRDVPEREAEGVRQLLKQHAIEFYETPGSAWGISAPMIWLRNDADRERAGILLDEFQREFTAKARADYQALKARGELPGVWDLLRRRPLKATVYLALILLLAYVSLYPFHSFGH
ncbi:MAG TPA: hypothetical protein ENJ19_05140 [Gammaproteobacteria bacterium]|nr:hypothetical protein [Gammaproteobacteria bacterium]